MANRNLIDYLPQYMRKYTEMQEIMAAEQVDIDGLWSATGDVYRDQFIADATENGISHWEKMLAISPKGTETLDERKYRILTRLNQELPYTMRKLEEVLTTLCGADGYTIILTANAYHLEVKLAIVNKNNYAEVESVVTKMIPANMTKVIAVMYNTHEVLAELTHAQLSAYTHEELREEVLE